MEMPPRQQYFAIFMAVALLFITIELVRRHKLKVEYSWLWLITSLGLLLLVVRYDLLVWLSALIGAVLPTTTLFISAIIFLALLMIHFSVKTTTHDNQIKTLTQELALLRSRLEESKNKNEEPPEEKPEDDKA